MSLLALLKEKKQALAATRRGKTVKPPMGRSIWRIFPSWRNNGDPNQQFWHDFAQHFVKGVDGTTLLAIYIDTEKTFGRPSEINALISQAMASTTDDAVMKALKDAKSSASVLLNAMQVDGDKPTEIQILEVRPTTFEQIVEIMTLYEEAGEPLLDVTAGKELIINREGTGLNTKYTVQAAVKNRGQVPSDWVKKLNDLDAYVQQENAEGAFKAMNAIKSIAGMLPAAVGGAAGFGTAGIPTTGAAARLTSGATPSVAPAEDEDMYAAAPAPGKRTAAPAPAPAPAVEEFEDVPAFDADPAPAPTPAPARRAAAPTPAPAPAAAAPAASTGDAELDSLLADLDS